MEGGLVWCILRNLDEWYASEDWIKPGQIVVMVNGEDVTGRAFAASTKEGFVLCYQRDARGNLVYDEYGNMRSETVTGEVEIRPTKPGLT